MAASTKPTIVLVCGAWHVPEHYQHLTSRLEKAGYTVHAIQLAATADQPTDVDASPSVAVLRTTIEQCADRGEDVMLVVHSAGGVAAGDGTKGLIKTDREKAGKKGGVGRMCYICAFAPAEGQSLYGATNGPEPWHNQISDTVTIPMRMREVFYNDLSDEVAEQSAKMTKKFATGFFKSEASYAPFKHVPSWYLICENDQAIPVVAQEAMTSQPGANFTIERCSASHSPFLSMPDLTAEFVRRAAGESI